MEEKGERHWDKGFSLMELIVVILIMGIVSTAVGISMTSVHNADVGAAAGTFATLLESARLEAIARPEKISVRLYEDEGYFYAEISAENSRGEKKSIDKEKLCSTKVKITVVQRMSADLTEQEKEIGTADYIELVYKKNGAVMPETEQVVKVVFSYGDSRRKTVSVIAETGRTVIE